MQRIDENTINEAAGMIPADWQDPEKLREAEQRLLGQMAVVRLALTSVRQTLRQMSEGTTRA